MTMSKLSVQQQCILLNLFSRTRLFEEAGVRLRQDWLTTSGLWLAWKPGGNHGDGHHSRSSAASVSRALRRLRERGLVEAVNGVSGSARRATNVCLTPAGRELAERLAGVNWGEDWLELRKVRYAGNG